MDALWSIGLAQTYLIHPDYLVVQCWVCAIYLSPDTINQIGPQTYHYFKFFERWLSYMPPGPWCDCIVDTIDKTNAAMPFIFTAYPVLWIAPVNHMPLCHKRSGVNLASMH